MSGAVPSPLEAVVVAHYNHGWMKNGFTAVIQRDGRWWVGWIEEIPGVNAQATTRRRLLEDLRVALKEAVELYRREALSSVKGAYEEATLHV